MLRSRFCAVLLSIVLLTTIAYCYEVTVGLTKKTGGAPSSSPPLIIYYSRTGNTRTVAQELARSLSCEIEEIISRKNRHLWGILTCVNDQLFDRDDVITPLKKDIARYNPLLIASPVWIHRISSPMRTFIKYSGLKGKDAVLILTNNGNFSEEDKHNIIHSVESYGITVKGCYSICSKDKSKDALQQDARSLVQDIAVSVNQ